jgi:ubiquinone/menaquinone biosynthesis C-methylase UbiE
VRKLDEVKSYYEKYAELYDKDYESLEWKLYDDLTFSYLEPFLPTILNKSNPPLILDVGGGTGKWAIKLAKIGYKIVCGDISDQMLEKAKSKVKAENLENKIEFRFLDVRTMPEMKNNSFDMVLALGDVISYALDDEESVKELYRVCKPGGYCVASVDNKFVFLINEIKGERWDTIRPLLQTGISDYFPAHPTKVYLPDELKMLFTQVGFSVEQIAGKPILLTLMPKKIRRRKLENQYELLLDLEKQFGKSPYLLGTGGHLQITAKKPM